METKYSKEYILKMVQAIILAVVLIAGMFGLPFTDSEKELVGGVAALVIDAVLGVMTLITMIRQKQKEGLTAVGRILPYGPRAKMEAMNN